MAIWRFKKRWTATTSATGCCGWIFTSWRGPFARCCFLAAPTNSPLRQSAIQRDRPSQRASFLSPLPCYNHQDLGGGSDGPILDRFRRHYCSNVEASKKWWIEVFE